MKKVIITGVFLLFCTASPYAQRSSGGIPRGFDLRNTKTRNDIRTHFARPINRQALINEDNLSKKGRTPLRYSIYEKVNIDLLSVGTRQEYQGGTLFRFRIVAENSIGISLIFSNFQIPEGAELFVYSEMDATVLGAFTSQNNVFGGSFRLAEYPAPDIVIEYFEPGSLSSQGKVELSHIGKVYRDPFTNDRKAEPFELDINCFQGDNFQLEKHAIAALSYQENGGGYFCTGALLNNTLQDGTPFFLTAHHCISNPNAAENLITYFNYETDDCDGSVIPGQTLSGSTLLATSEATDFTLLQLDEIPPASYRPYYLGWNAAYDSTVPLATGIHHPLGLPKMIAFDFNEVYSYPFREPWLSSPTSVDYVSEPHTNWSVTFDEGIIAPGSSGSPLLDEKKRVIGQTQGSGPRDMMLYGKISASWNNSDDPSQSLKHWLDPENSGSKLLDGYQPPVNYIKALPRVAHDRLCAGSEIQLSDASYPNPESWKWNINSSTYEYRQGTDSLSQHPVVAFLAAGSYDISLEVSSDTVSDSRTRKQYVHAGTALTMSVHTNREDVICYADFNEVLFIGKGADSLAWQVDMGNNYILIDSADLYSDTLAVMINDTVAVDGSYEIKVMLTGYQGECIDSAEKTVLIDLLPNDMIANALPIELGKQGPYSNFCASVEENEPHPETGECNTQLSWCDNPYGNEILHNSVWFSFTGAESGMMTITALGFDNQMAVYQASKWEDLITGNASDYELIAANDNYFGANVYWASRLMEFSVNPGSKYWLQVDGGSNGVTGSFELDLDEIIIEKAEEKNTLSANIRVYPNPAYSQIMIDAPHLLHHPEISLIQLDGSIVYRKEFETADRHFEISLPADISTGIYFIRVVSMDLHHIEPLWLTR